MSSAICPPLSSGQLIASSLSGGRGWGSRRLTGFVGYGERRSWIISLTSQLAAVGRGSPLLQQQIHRQPFVDQRILRQF